MTTRTRLIGSLLGAALFASAPGAVLGQQMSAVVTFIEAQGYNIVQIERTWLGRIRIEAVRGNLEREMIIDPNTGEILRDYIEEAGDDSWSFFGDSGSDDRARDNDGDSASGGGGATGSGATGYGYDDGDDRDDRDSDNDRDSDDSDRESGDDRDDRDSDSDDDSGSDSSGSGGGGGDDRDDRDSGGGGGDDDD